MQNNMQIIVWDNRSHNRLRQSLPTNPKEVVIKSFYNRSKKSKNPSQKRRDKPKTNSPKGIQPKKKELTKRKSHSKKGTVPRQTTSHQQSPKKFCHVRDCAKQTVVVHYIHVCTFLPQKTESTVSSQRTARPFPAKAKKRITFGCTLAPVASSLEPPPRGSSPGVSNL